MEVDAVVLVPVAIALTIRYIDLLWWVRRW